MEKEKFRIYCFGVEKQDVISRETPRNIKYPLPIMQERIVFLTVFSHREHIVEQCENNDV